MESRTIKVSFNEAYQWYCGDNPTLRILALKAFKEEEFIEPYKKIRTFNDVLKHLNIGHETFVGTMLSLKSRGMQAIYKLSLIQEALNQGWKFKFLNTKTDSSGYYPWVKFYEKTEAEEHAKNWHLKLHDTFVLDDVEYVVVSGGYGNFYGYDNINSIKKKSILYIPNLSSLLCKSETIAVHMATYFSKEIFEATYAPLLEGVTWV